ncbi:hypothetical protein [Sporosarcina cyprini]|uniref:hypothetical protein n=1 Tax=Sporosarcina cyprini TaxID=2910523 RepID=UPI001EE07E96|nr:hypothetical protein [Sporosarcina cyprini]MCG3087891.1 hypothetical protein [Sporosarcina cyprini]
MKKWKVLTIGSLVCAICLLIPAFKPDVWDYNLELMKGQIRKMDPQQQVALSDITPFEWDVLYSFVPYASKEAVYETVGYRWDNIQETVSEGMNQIVFMHDGKVVCHIYGYPANNGFGLYVKGQNEGEPFVSINSSDHIILTPKQMKDAILLYQTEK